MRTKEEIAAYKAAWTKANRERINEQRRAAYATRPEVRESKAEYQKRTRTIANARSKAWYRKHRDEVREKYRVKYHANIGKQRERQQIRAARKKEALALGRAARAQVKDELRALGYFKRWRSEKINASDRAWRALHPDRVKAANRKAREALTDAYVRNNLGLTTKSRVPPTLIDLKREQLRLHRLLRDFKQAITKDGP